MINEPASGEQLRRLWQNLKTRQRDGLTKERQHRMATGGGGPCPDADINPNIAEICPALFVEIPNTLDSDCIDFQPVPDAPDTQTIDIHETNQQESIETHHTSEQTQESIETHQTIQEPPPPEELSSNEKKLRVQILKLEYLNRERRASELHDLNIKHMIEKHRLEMEILKQKLKSKSTDMLSVDLDG